MRKLLTTTWLLLLILSAWVVFSIYLSFSNNDWEWFQRSGSIITLFGAIIASRKLIRLNIKKSIELHNAPDTWKPSKEKLEEQGYIEEDIKVETTGFILILVGTVIWGYGDLCAKLINT